MAEPRNLPGMDATEPAKRAEKQPVQALTAQAIDWFSRDFEESEKWKKRGRSIYLSTGGDSVVSRYHLADELRTSLLKQESAPVESQMWTADEESPVTTKVHPPKINDSNASYVDWIRIADYFLLNVRVPWEEFEQENLKRNQLYERAKKNLELRQKVAEAKAYLQDHPKAKNDEIRAALKKTEIEVAAMQLKLARDEIKAGIPDPVEKEPEPPSQLQPYTTLYF